MMSTHVQDASTGRVDVVQGAIRNAAESLDVLNAMDVAVAYASRRGVNKLVGELSGIRTWPVATKRFLVSIDYGTTEPAALELLAGLPASQVRVPRGRRVLKSPRLAPETTFHAKCYLFRDGRGDVAGSFVVGSANMTVSALAVGGETVASFSWAGALTPQDQLHVDSVLTYKTWFEEAWADADELAVVLDAYRALRKTLPKPRKIPEERTPGAKIYSRAPQNQAGRVLQLSSADAIWFQTPTLNANRGPGLPGNQLDVPRNTRAFFGFPVQRVEPNTRLGTIEVRVPGFQAVEVAVRFGDNSMEKLNFPIPGTAGPASYDNAFVVFTRNGSSTGGLPRFVLDVMDDLQLGARKASVIRALDFTMQGGRRWGLLFG